MPADRRDRLTTDPFTYLTTKDRTVRVSRGGRVVATVGGDRARRLLREIEDTNGDEDRVQQLLARVTGNYRRGNERTPTDGASR